MVKYKSTKGFLYIGEMAIVALCMIGGLIGSILFLTGILRVLTSIFYIAVIIVELWIFFATYYVFGDDALLCKCGPFSETIAYTKLKTATKCKGYVFSMALSELRIELRYGKSDITSTVFISPENEDEFLEVLSTKCEKLTVQEA